MSPNLAGSPARGGCTWDEYGICVRAGTLRRPCTALGMVGQGEAVQAHFNTEEEIREGSRSSSGAVKKRREKLGMRENIHLPYCPSDNQAAMEWKMTADKRAAGTFNHFRGRFRLPVVLRGGCVRKSGRADG